MGCPSVGDRSGHGLVRRTSYPSFYIEHFSNGPSAQAEFELSVEWVAQHGPTLEPEERAELDSRLAEEISIFDRQLGEIPEAAAVGVTDYDSFQIFSGQHNHNEMEMQAEWKIRDRTNCDTISIIQHMPERYDDPRDYLWQHDYFESYTYLKYLAQWTAMVEAAQHHSRPQAKDNGWD